MNFVQLQSTLVGGAESSRSKGFGHLPVLAVIRISKPLDDPVSIGEVEILGLKANARFDVVCSGALFEVGFDVSKQLGGDALARLRGVDIDVAEVNALPAGKADNLPFFSSNKELTFVDHFSKLGLVHAA